MEQEIILKFVKFTGDNIEECMKVGGAMNIEEVEEYCECCGQTVKKKFLVVLEGGIINFKLCNPGDIIVNYEIDVPLTKIIRKEHTKGYFFSMLGALDKVQEAKVYIKS